MGGPGSIIRSFKGEGVSLKIRAHQAEAQEITMVSLFFTIPSTKAPLLLVQKKKKLQPMPIDRFLSFCETGGVQLGSVATPQSLPNRTNET